MGTFIQLLGMTVVGVMLLWFGYTLFFGTAKRPVAPPARVRKKKHVSGVANSFPGAPKTCPVCSARLDNGERVRSTAFPGIPGQGRMMHIAGCVYCIQGDRPRNCPVCGNYLKDTDYLVARMFDRPLRSHVHVLGCNQCRPFGG